MRKRLLNVVLVSSLAAVLGGCVNRKAAEFGVPALEKPRAANEAPSVGNYLRGVIKISIDNASKDEAMERLLEAQPQLADLAKRVSSHPADFAAAKTLAAAYLDADLYGSAYEIYYRIHMASAKDPAVEMALGRIWDSWGDFILAEEAQVRRSAGAARKDLSA
jgi:Flp pilus assembly protein TadD